MINARRNLLMPLTPSAQIRSESKGPYRTALLIPGLLVLALLAGCSPRVEVAVPQEPITINLNVKIEHEIQVKVDREIDELFDEKSELF